MMLKLDPYVLSICLGSLLHRTSQVSGLSSASANRTLTARQLGLLEDVAAHHAGMARGAQIGDSHFVEVADDQARKQSDFHMIGC